MSQAGAAAELAQCPEDPGRSGGQSGAEGTHVDEVLPVADKQVAQDARLVEVPQADHVLHTVDRSGVHRLDVCGVLWGDPVLLQEAQCLVSAHALDPGCALHKKGLGSGGRLRSVLLNWCQTLSSNRFQSFWKDSSGSSS